jgi:site-specific DNA recombinase
MEKIVLYSRVSTLDQNYESQFEDLRRWAASNNFEVVASYGEKVSGYDINAERVEYDKMKDFVIKNNIFNIGIWEISRLSRSMVKTVTEIDWFTKHKINLHFKKENLRSISDNVTNQLLITILSSMAQMERDTFIDRGIRGRMSAVMRGRAIGYSTMPYGYGKDEKGIIKIAEEEAKIVRKFYDWTIKGWQLNTMAREVNSLNIPTRHTLQGKKRKIYTGETMLITWKPNVIRRIVQNTIYKGVRFYRDIKVPMPAIVDEETWNKAQDRFKYRIGYMNRTKYDYLFKSMMRCGHCNFTFITSTNSRTKYSLYSDNGRQNRYRKCLEINALSTKVIDDVLYKQLFLNKDGLVQAHKDLKKDSNIEDKKNQVIYYKNEIVKLESKQKRIVKLYSEAYINEDEFKNEMESIRKDKIEFENKISMNNMSLNIRQFLGTKDVMMKYYNTNKFNVKREFVEKYVNKILIYRVRKTNLKFEKPLHKNEKTLYIEIYAFGNLEPLRIVLTVYTKNVIVDRNLSYFKEIGYLVKG